VLEGVQYPASHDAALNRTVRHQTGALFSNPNIAMGSWWHPYVYVQGSRFRHVDDHVRWCFAVCESKHVP
jgi:hypothetical protein